MELLQEAREIECGTSYGSFCEDSLPTPLVHVRKVQLVGSGFPSSESPDCTMPIPKESSFRRNGVQIPKPAFGSGSNLVGLGFGGSPKIHPSEPILCRSLSVPRGTTPRQSPCADTPPGSTGLHHSIPRPAFGGFTNPLHMEDEGIGYTSEHDDISPAFGYEVTIATTDRQGLLKYFTSALSDSHLQLNIKVYTEVHCGTSDLHQSFHIGCSLRSNLYAERIATLVVWLDYAEYLLCYNCLTSELDWVILLSYSNVCWFFKLRWHIYSSLSTAISQGYKRHLASSKSSCLIDNRKHMCLAQPTEWHWRFL